MSNGGMRPHLEALYYHIALDALQAAKAEVAKVEQNDSTEFKRKESVTTSMVFSALCLEAFINQEYMRHPETSKLLVDDDRFPLETKWLMLPLLLGSGGTFDTGAPPYQTFKDLVKTRNRRLVHFHPHRETQKTGGEPYNQEYLGEFVGNIAFAEKYMGCVENMIIELHRLTQGKTDKPNFLKGSRYVSTVWSSFSVHIEGR